MVDFQDLMDTPISAEDIKEGLAADLFDTGWYQTSEIKFEAREVSQGNNAGRRYIHFTATLLGKEDGEFVVEDGIKGRKAWFNASPEIKPDKNGKPDFMFKLWSQVVSAVGGGEKVSEVLDKLAFTLPRLRINKGVRRDTGEPESTIVNIKA